MPVDARQRRPVGTTFEKVMRDLAVTSQRSISLRRAAMPEISIPDQRLAFLR